MPLLVLIGVLKIDQNRPIRWHFNIETVHWLHAFPLLRLRSPKGAWQSLHWMAGRQGERGREKKASILKMASPVWEFYNVPEKDNTFAVCKVCAKEIPWGGTVQKNFNTMDLIRHLKVSQIEEYTEFFCWLLLRQRKKRSMQQPRHH